MSAKGWTRRVLARLRSWWFQRRFVRAARKDYRDLLLAGLTPDEARNEILLALRQILISDCGTDPWPTWQRMAREEQERRRRLSVRGGL